MALLHRSSSFSLLFALLLVILSTTCVFANVVDLDANNFDKTVLDGRGMWLVAFVAPWCPHCQRLEPELEKAAKSLGGIVNIARVNADQERSLGGRYEIKGFPTLKVFGVGARSKDKQNPEDYQGARSAKAIVDYMMYKFNALKDPVTVVKNLEQLKKEAENTQVPLIVLFTAKAQNPALFKSIALEFDTPKDLKFMVVTNADTKKDIMDACAVSENKALIVIPPGSSDIKNRGMFSGQMNKEQIMKFLGSFVMAKSKFKTATASSQKQGASAEASATGDKASASAHTSTSEQPKKNYIVTVKSQKELEDACAKLCVLSVLDTNEEKKRLELLKDLSSKYGIKRDIIRFAVVDKSAVDLSAFEDSFTRPAEEATDALDVVVIRGQRKKYLRRADLNTSNASDFFDRVLDGFNGLTFSNLESGIPKIVASAGNGKDEL